MSADAYAPAGSLLVLIVEDEEAIITLLDYNLRNGYLTAIAGTVAVDLARAGTQRNPARLDVPLRSGQSAANCAGHPRPAKC